MLLRQKYHVCLIITEGLPQIRKIRQVLDLPKTEYIKKEYINKKWTISLKPCTRKKIFMY